MIKTVLITGANGRIGSTLVSHIDAQEVEYELRLTDLKVDDERGMAVDITDLAACRSACAAVDTVIHLAAVASPEASFEEILPTNIVGTYNVFRAASEAGVRRIVYASSAHVVAGYPLDVQVRTDMPVRPRNLYGVSKAYGEALAAYFAYQRQVEVVAVRIGAFGYKDDWVQMSADDLGAWADPEDLCSLLVRCIEAEMTGGPFLIAHGISDNRFKRLDLADTRSLLGYDPKADAFEEWSIDLHDSSVRRV
jgi:uronate dehydrogenase